MEPNKSLSPVICLNILHNNLTNYSTIELVNYEITPISQDVEGYMGEHFNLIISYKIDGKIITKDFFMKRRPTKTKIQNEAIEEIGIYKREIFFYEFLMKEFKKCVLNVSFTAKSYYCIPNEALILENLKNTGFNLLPRNTVFKIEQLKSLLKSLALFHAAGYVYEQIKTKELNKQFKLGTEYYDNLQELIFVHFINPNAYVMKFWTGCYNTLNALIELLPNDKAYIKEYKRMFNNYELGKIFIEEHYLKKTSCHGDLWSNNMMFKINNGAVECKLLDFQTVRYFYPSFDIILAIYCNTDKNFREKYLKELYEYYYNVLSKTVSNHEYNIEQFLTHDEFHKSLVLVKPDALIKVAFTNTLICMPKDTLNKCTETNEGMNEFMFGNVQKATEAFRKNQLYRTTLTETLIELNDALRDKE